MFGGWVPPSAGAPPPPEEDDVEVGEADKTIADWRLLCLYKVYERAHPVLDEDELNALVRLADSKADLRQIEVALERGCGLGEALSIFLD